MIYFCYFLLSFILLRTIISTINWLTQPYLNKKIHTDENILVSILIPARNEEHTIGKLLSDIENISYPHIEVIVYNDSSEDNTENVVMEFSERNDTIRITTGSELPKGWLGKNHACHNLALNAKGDYFLFLDADVRIEKDIIEKALFKLMYKKTALLSIFPKQIMLTTGEKKVVPIMNQILLSLLPLFLVKASRKRSLSAANGQFMFFKADVYKQMKPHESLKNSVVEDISIVKYFKKNRIKCQTLLGKNDVSCRMYHSEEEAISGFSKNILHFFSNSYLFTFFYLIISNFGLPIVFIFSPYYFGLAYLAAMFTNKITVSAAAKQNVCDNFKFWFIQQLNFNKIVLKAIKNRKEKSYFWKGRDIYN